MERGNISTMWLLVWVVILIVIIRSRFKKDIPSAGLPVAFALVFSLDHWFGGLIYSFPWYESYNYPLVKTGFRYSLYALTAFAFGSLILAPLFINIFRFPWLNVKTHTPDIKLPRIYLWTGFIFYFVLGPVLSGIVSVRTLVYSSWNLLIAGVCLECWDAWRMKRKEALTKWLLFAAIAPFFTMITGGFLGVGTMTLLAILCFVSVFYRPRWRLILGALLAIYFGLSLFVSYMEYRGELREVIWAKRPMSVRMKVISKMLGNFELINLRKRKHLGHIDSRLNQNYLVGAAVHHIEAGNETYAGGKTILDSLFAIIPRIIWKGKPMTLGGTALIAKYTGLSFREMVSVAIGLVIEFYINFSTIGVIIGFSLVGAILTIIDTACGNRIKQGDWQGFIYLFIPSLALVVSTSFVQITMTAAASIVFCLVVNRFILPRTGAKKRSG